MSQRKLNMLAAIRLLQVIVEMDDTVPSLTSEENSVLTEEISILRHRVCNFVNGYEHATREDVE